MRTNKIVIDNVQIRLTQRVEDQHHLALAPAAWPAAALLALIRSNARHTVSDLALCTPGAHAHAHILMHIHMQSAIEPQYSLLESLVTVRHSSTVQ